MSAGAGKSRRGHKARCKTSGMEPSPRAHGICAWQVEEGREEKGGDGCLWRAERDKQGHLYWRRLGGLFPGDGGCAKSAGRGRRPFPEAWTESDAEAYFAALRANKVKV